MMRPLLAETSMTHSTKPVVALTGYLHDHSETGQFQARCLLAKKDPIFSEDSHMVLVLGGRASKTP